MWSLSPCHGADGQTSADTASQDEPSRPFLIFSGNGLEGGEGRKSYQGFRWQDSLSASAREHSGGNTFKEALDLSTSRRFRSLGRLAESNMDVTLDFDRGGFSASADGGFDYTGVIYNRQTRTEIQLDSNVWNFTGGAGVSQKFVLDPDSTLDWTWTGSYQEYAFKIHTFGVQTKMNKEWDDFSAWGELAGSRQRQDSIPGKCSKNGKENASASCSTLGSDLTDDVGVAAGVEWEPGKHDFAFQTGFDWLFMEDRKTKAGSGKTKSANSLERTWVSTIGYTYSPSDWLDVGGYFQKGISFEAAKSSGYWMTGLYFALDY